MALTPGTTLGPYKILSALGAGGQGEVYKAWDTRLDRNVALKVLPAHLRSNPELKQRFDREAHALAALDHPHIVRILDVGNQDGLDYIVMEYLDGETVAARLQKGPMPLDQALRIAIEIADALDTVHRQGVTHRDAKTSNLMLVKSGSKLIDFGLAKVRQPAAAVTNMSQLPTGTNLTARGTILGTLQYMAPEQLEGKEADARTDIFAFGEVLYEMLTGRKAFEGTSEVSLIGAILKDDPPAVSMLQPMTPPALDTVVKGCLAKEADERWHSAGDVMRQLKWIVEEKSARAAAAPAPAPQEAPAPKRNRLAWIVAAAALLIALGMSALYFRGASGMTAEVPPMRVEITTPSTSDIFSLALSPDGRRLVFVASSEGSERLWLRSLDAATAQPLAGTEGASYPFWSPDSRSIGFFAERKLKRTDIAGGAPQVLANAPGGRGGTWSRDGVIVFAESRGPLYNISASGGDVVAITKLDPPRQTTHRFPHFLPDGRRLLFSAGIVDQPMGIYLGSLDSTESRRLITAETAVAYGSGHLLYLRHGALVAHRFDASRGELSGDPVPVADSVGFNSGVNVGAFSASATGMLAYRPGGASRQQLVWLDRSGKEFGTLGSPDQNNLGSPELSPDGRRVAVNRLVQGNWDVWLIETARGVAGRFTFDAAEDYSPIWSPDGSRIVFSSTRKGALDLYQELSSGVGTEVLLLESSLPKIPSDWSPDGRFILYMQLDPKTGDDLWVLPISGERKPFPFVNTSFTEREGQFSPDGRWVAYQSNESGRNEVYVQPFPGPGGKWQVSTGGGISPRWRGDRKELFYISPEAKLMAAGIQAKGETLEAGAPAALFQTRIVAGGTGLGFPTREQYAVAPDGRFLMNVVAEEASTAPITLILNWPALLKK